MAVKLRLPKDKIVTAGIIVAALALITFGAAGLLKWHKKTAAPVEAVTANIAQTVTNSTDSPDETKIDTKTANYKVPADMPRLISLPTIGAEGFVQRVGIDQHNAIAVPSSVHVAGWFTGSAKPGNKGLSIIDGHVQGVYQQGVFKNLAKMAAGDKFTVQYGDGSIRTFQVVSNNQYSPQQTATKQFEQLPGVDNQLNLITCGGKYVKAQKAYDKRVLIAAKSI
jgi:LPXTG-site transpeptidase (sortase) family protein